jgi:hypothetical protein
MRMQPRPVTKAAKAAELDDQEWNIVIGHLYDGQYKNVAGVIAKLSQQLLQQEFGNGPGETEPPAEPQTRVPGGLAGATCGG